MNNEFHYEDIADQLFIMNVATVDRLFALGPDEFLLYSFYLKTAKWQKSTEVWANNEYVMKCLGWGLKKVRAAKESLAKNGFVEQIRVVDDSSGKVKKWKVKLKYIQGINHQDKNDPVDDKTTGAKKPLVPFERQDNNNNKISKEIPENNNNTPVILRNTIPYGNNITSYNTPKGSERVIPPTGDVLGERRPTKGSEIKDPTTKTTPEDVRLVNVDLDSIQVGDWERLVNWFEYNRRYKNKVIKPYCKREFKQVVEMLKNLTGGNWFYAIDALEYAVERCYHGFGNAKDGLFYGLKSSEDYELEMSLAMDFKTHPEDLPDRVMRYKPLVLDETIKYRQKWADDFEKQLADYEKEYAENKDNPDYLRKRFVECEIEKLKIDLKRMRDGLKWCYDQKNALQNPKMV